MSSSCEPSFCLLEPHFVTYRPVRRDAGLRVVHPLALVHKTGTWYLIARLGDRVLVYRLDRLLNARMLDAPVQRPPDFDLAEFWRRWEEDYASSLPTFFATVRLGPEAQRYRDAFGAASPRAVFDEATDADGWVRQTLLFDSRRVARAVLLALAPEVEVIHPAELRKDLAATAMAVAARNT